MIIITNLSLFLNMIDEEVYSIIDELAEKNGTEQEARELKLFIRSNGELCQADYEHTSRDQRFSSGKLEKTIFALLAIVVNKQNKNGNAKKASRIMFLLGYKSYYEKTNRFRQKMENLLKKERKDQKKSCEKKVKRKERRAKKGRKDQDLSMSESNTCSEASEETMSSSESSVLSSTTPIQPTISYIGTSMPLPVQEMHSISTIGYNSNAETIGLDSMEGREPSPIPFDCDNIRSISSTSGNNFVSMSRSEMFDRRQDSIRIGMEPSYAVNGIMTPLQDDLYSSYTTNQYAISWDLMQSPSSSLRSGNFSSVNEKENSPMFLFDNMS